MGETMRLRLIVPALTIAGATALLAPNLAQAGTSVTPPARGNRLHAALTEASLSVRAPKSTSVPPQLEPPAGNSLSAVLIGSGVQIYQCGSGAWSLLEPAAQLAGVAVPGGAFRTAIHFHGPSWESIQDGSLVQGSTLVSQPVAGAIPELLLKATANRGDGTFGRVRYIQRLATKGGVAPAGACADGQTTAVPYSAVYRFFTPTT
jgi:hypothetical protein